MQNAASPQAKAPEPWEIEMHAMYENVAGLVKNIFAMAAIHKRQEMFTKPETEHHSIGFHILNCAESVFNSVEGFEKFGVFQAMKEHLEQKSTKQNDNME